MKKILLAAGLLLMLGLNACESVKTILTPQDKKTVYRFTDDPYDTLGVDDPRLYNYVFALTKNRLKYYVENTFESYPELLGLVLELKVRGHQSVFKNIVESPAVRGWRIYDEDIIGLTEEEITELNRGSSQACEVCKYPKVRYAIQVKGDQAQVYVSYWILQYRTYNFLYLLKKQGKDWTIIDSIEK